MVADALDDRRRTGVAHREALARQTANERLAARCAVQRHVADDHVLLGGELRVAIRSDDDPTARQALAGVVVRVAFQTQRDAARQERAEALSGRAAQADVDRVVWQARCRRDRRVTSEPSIVPTLRLVLRTGRSI